jgi:hypothetical protein
MVATPTRIGFVMEEWRRATATTPAVKERHGELARETEDPIEAYFDNVADAQAIADARQALLSPERRRFNVATVGLEHGLALNYLDGVIPNGHYVDTAKAADMDVLVAEVGFDFEKQRTSLRVWG